MQQSGINKILAKEYTLQEILDKKKYTVDYFQREYKWQRENIEQLITDLVQEFNNNYTDGDDTPKVATYSTYYMGSIVLSSKLDGRLSVIDGQQRLTSLTLLLIYLNNLTKPDYSSLLASLIYSDSYGVKSFNIDVDERKKCLEALFNDGEYTPTDDDEASVITMAERYQDIANCFPDDMEGQKLRSFLYWLTGRVILVQITAPSEDNAYTIFETMNNRGVALTNSDMLKGFILSNFTDDAKRRDFNQQWKQDMLSLSEFGKDTDNLFFQSWLRAQFAETIRQTKIGAVNMDFENIGSRFHNWFKDNYKKGLLAAAINGNIENFMDKNYKFYLKWFKKIKNAEESMQDGLERIYYLRWWGIAPSLTYPLLLAPLKVTDTDDEINQKLDLVTRYIDGFVVRRAVNFKMFAASSIRFTMCNLVKTIRGKSKDELKVILQEKMAEVDREFNFRKGMESFRLHGQNKYFVKYFLCRLTTYLDEGCKLSNSFVAYMTSVRGDKKCKPYEIEHIWSNHPECHTAEFPQKSDFEVWRNKIGGLVLLQNGTNQSLNDMSVVDKLPIYFGQNTLTKSLATQAYKNNPNFTNFYSKEKLDFVGYTDIKKKDIEARCLLYAAMADKIWSLTLD